MDKFTTTDAAYSVLVRVWSLCLGLYLSFRLVLFWFGKYEFNRIAISIFAILTIIYLIKLATQK